VARGQFLYFKKAGKKGGLKDRQQAEMNNETRKRRGGEGRGREFLNISLEHTILVIPYDQSNLTEY
jgi:hypothetical protein